MDENIQQIIESDYLIQRIHKFKFGDIHIKHDPQSDFFSIIAIHNTKLGPALGGCRMLSYKSFDEALNDVTKLAQAMSYKAALAGLPLGGGKAIIFKPKTIEDRQGFFQTFGKFVEELNGRYITAVDSGTTSGDMDIVAEETKHVTSRANKYGDPSPITATGVLRAMQATVKFKLGQDNLAGLRVAIQGVGKVGEHLARDLADQKAQLFLTDINEAKAMQLAQDLQAQFVKPDAIYGVDCDVFAPCALGGILNDDTLPQLKAKMIVGATNNQLHRPHHGEALREMNILYTPDYIVNSGGLICACAEYYNYSMDKVKQQVEEIYNATLNICERAAKENLATSVIADKIAQEKIANA
ncbi:MAG: amino acid dehydrogenase [Pseudomonadota bacterium]